MGATPQSAPGELHLSVGTKVKDSSRRGFLARAGQLGLTLGWLRSSFGAPRSPYSSGVWLAGDHHIHTRFSVDGQYSIGEQAGNAARHGIHWCVITDHGSAKHDKVAVEQAYPELLAARGDLSSSSIVCCRSTWLGFLRFRDAEDHRARISEPALGTTRRC